MLGMRKGFGNTGIVKRLPTRGEKSPLGKSPEGLSSLRAPGGFSKGPDSLGDRLKKRRVTGRGILGFGKKMLAPSD